jgi:hypothetical protein
VPEAPQGKIQELVKAIGLEVAGRVFREPLKEVMRKAMREFMLEPNNSASSPASAEEFLLVISRDAEFRGEVQLELRRRQNRVRVAFVDGLEPARSTLQNHLPAVILLEDRALLASAGPRHKSSLLSAAVGTLVTHAPAVVIGNPEHRSGLAPLLATGAADYVPRSLSCVSAAVGIVERWLRLRRGAPPRSALAVPAAQPAGSGLPSHSCNGHAAISPMNRLTPATSAKYYAMN